MNWFSRKKNTSIPTIETKAQAIVPNLPIIEALGKLNVQFTDIRERAQYAKAFTEVGEVYSVITYLAKAFSNMNVKLYQLDAGGGQQDEIVSHEILTKLRSPNPLNNWTDFLKNYFINKKVFGNGYIYKYMPSGFKKMKDASLWVLPSQYVYPAPEKRKLDKTYYQGDSKDYYVRGYSLYNRVNFTQPIQWDSENVLHQKEPRLFYSTTEFLQDLIEGESPLRSLQEPITNIRKAYEAQNVILQKRGALGMITPKSGKDGVSIGATTLTPQNKKDLQDQLLNYGLGREDWQFIISNIEMQYQAMSVPIRELMLFEGIENSMRAICNTYNFPILLLNYVQGATFNNVNELKKSLYQDNIIPEAKAFISELNSFLGLDKQNLLLKADFSHIPVLQSDAKIEAEKDKITIDTILSIQEGVSGGKVSVEAASTMLSMVLGMPEDDIGNIITPPQTNQITEQNAQTDGSTNV